MAKINCFSRLVVGCTGLIKMWIDMGAKNN